MQKWDYLHLVRNIDYVPDKGLLSIGGSLKYTWSDGDNMGFEERLSYLGDQGWEVISIYPVSLVHGTSINTSDTTSIRILLKRPKE